MPPFLSALPVCPYASLYAYQVWIDEKPLGGVEVISLPALPLPPDHGESGGGQILSEVRELYVCKVRSGSQMQWKSLRVSLVMGRGGGDEEDEASDGSEVSEELSHDAVWFAEMDRLFELGGLSLSAVSSVSSVSKSARLCLCPSLQLSDRLRADCWSRLVSTMLCEVSLDATSS
jgi:hypothetical protein